MKKYIYFCLLAIGLTLLGCSKDDEPKTTVSDGPDIGSFSPTSGPVGTSIWITGKNFSATASANIVKIGTTTATITSAKATEIFVTVPEGATTGTISVTVNGKTDTSGSFTVTETPKESVFPTVEGLSDDKLSPGDQLTINGSGFDPDGTYVVTFPENLVGSIAEVTETSLMVEVPEGAISGEITLTFDQTTETVGTLEIEPLASFYTFDYTLYRLGKIDIETGDISFIGSDIPFGYNAENAVIFDNKYIGLQINNPQHVASPNIVSIDLDTGTYEVTMIADIDDQVDFNDLVVDSDGNLFAFHDSDVDRLAKIDLDSGELTYIGEAANPNYGSNTRGAVYHNANNEYIGFAIQNENLEDQPHLERFNLETGQTTTVNIPESFLEVGNDFEELIIGPDDELYIFHTSANMLAKIDIDTGDLTYIENEYAGPVYGLNSRGAVIYDNQFIGFQMFDENYMETVPNISFIDLETGESSNVAINIDLLPDPINLTGFAIKK